MQWQRDRHGQQVHALHPSDTMYSGMYQDRFGSMKQALESVLGPCVILGYM